MSKKKITNFQVAILNAIARIEHHEHYKQLQKNKEEAKQGRGVTDIAQVWVSATGIAQSLGYKRASTYHLTMLRELTEMGYLHQAIDDRRNIYRFTIKGGMFVDNLTVSSQCYIEYYGIEQKAIVE